MPPAKASLRDCAKAAEYLRRSAEQGDTVGTHFVDEFEDHAWLNPNERARAERMIAEFRARKAHPMGGSG